MWGRRRREIAALRARIEATEAALRTTRATLLDHRCWIEALLAGLTEKGSARHRRIGALYQERVTALLKPPPAETGDGEDRAP